MYGAYKRIENLHKDCCTKKSRRQKDRDSATKRRCINVLKTNRGQFESINTSSNDATIVRELKTKFYRKLPSENEEQGSGFRANSPDSLN